MKTLFALGVAFAILAALPHDAQAQIKKYDIKSESSPSKPLSTWGQ